MNTDPNSQSHIAGDTALPSTPSGDGHAAGSNLTNQHTDPGREQIVSQVKNPVTGQSSTVVTNTQTERST